MIKTEDSCYILIEQFGVCKFGGMLKSDEDRFLAIMHGCFFEEEPSLRFSFAGLCDPFPAYVDRHEITALGRLKCSCQGNRLSAVCA